ncbi:hypothetical protein KVV02_008059 [Mortierella alpina]|uniref:Methyltransferase type 11 domain-containing protein n=1 Tax=Mortierella alpina TaxID=64518 RepID=A0A9P7ZX76_MORAP|nr:hypothetical protein KVV02_008059 [Mortierella alpina]
MLLLKSTCSILLALVLATSVAAQILPIFSPPPEPPSSSASRDPPTSVATSAVPVVTTSAQPTVAPTSAGSSAPPSQATSRARPTGSTGLSTSASTALPSGTVAPKPSDDSGNKLATAGIVVASVVVAAAIGIWVFRKWKLSPSRDFQSKIRGDEYSDYPRNYDSDTLHLRNMGDTPPVEPSAAKSPYNAQTAFPVEDQYYDPNYAAKDQAGYPAQGAYGHDYQGYDQGAYNEHGYAQGHVDYNGSQAGGYGGDYSQQYNNQGGYPQSNAGGGYQQHGYDGYNRHQPQGLMSFLSRFSRTQLVIGGLLTYATGVSAALTFLPSSKLASDSESGNDRFPSESTRRTTFDTLAPGYDSEVGTHEYLLGIQRRRKRLLKLARGRVLEIASGTGRNVDYYTKGCCNEIVFSDFSEGMMEVLKQKVAASDLGKRYDYQQRRQQQLELERIAQSSRQVSEKQEQDPSRQGDVAAAVSTTEEALSQESSTTMTQPQPTKVVETEIRFKTLNAAAIPYPDQSFDTVVDTFGLCSFEDPVQVLKEMKRVLRVGGKLLLLEHGNSHWGFMKDMQAKQLDRHVQKYGCYWNREIEELVAEAGLKVVEKERSQLGTVYYIIAE